MLTIKRYLMFFFIVLLLVGCEEKREFSDLMRNPNRLKQEINRCESKGFIKTQDKAEANYCQTVIRAAENMLSFIQQLQEDPEKFGERLLRLQITAENTKIMLNKEVGAKRDQLQKRYASLQQEIAIMLAVIGLNTPE